MEVKKSPKADLEGKKTIFLEIGFVIALGILLSAFNWKTNTKVEEGFVITQEEQVDEEIIPITQQMMKPPPPPPPAPKLTDLIEIVEDELSIDEELEIDDAEADVENKSNYNFDYDGDSWGEEESDGEADIFQVVEDMPQFPGGSVQKWIAKNVKYPMIAQENNIQGKVFVQFVIGKDGSVSNVKVADPLTHHFGQRSHSRGESMPKMGNLENREVNRFEYLTLYLSTSSYSKKTC